MTLGTGVFLSAIFLGIVALLIGTKEKWTWKGLFLYPLLVIVVLGSVITAAIYGYGQGYYGPNKIGKEMEYAGIRLRSTKSDVLFAKGKPIKEEAPDDMGEVVFTYGDSDFLIWVWFGKDGLVSGVSAACNPGSNHKLPSLKNISNRSDLSSIQGRLGKADFVKDIDGGVSRVYGFPRYNLRVAYCGGEMELLGIRDYEKYPYQPDRKQ